MYNTKNQGLIHNTWREKSLVALCRLCIMQGHMACIMQLRKKVVSYQTGEMHTSRSRRVEIGIMPRHWSTGSLCPFLDNFEFWESMLGGVFATFERRHRPYSARKRENAGSVFSRGLGMRMIHYGEIEKPEMCFVSYIFQNCIIQKINV